MFWHVPSSSLQATLNSSFAARCRKPCSPCHAEGILPLWTASGLLRAAAGDPEKAALVLRRAVELGKAVYRIIAAAAVGSSATAADLAILNAELSKGMAGLCVVEQQGTFAWAWNQEEARLDRVLFPVARAAATLLTSPDLARARKCAGDGCGWLFIDKSRNQSRRWCDMSDCGNRAKARRHYQRMLAAR